MPISHEVFNDVDYTSGVDCQLVEEPRGLDIHICLQLRR